MAAVAPGAQTPVAAWPHQSALFPFAAAPLQYGGQPTGSLQCPTRAPGFQVPLVPTQLRPLAPGLSPRLQVIEPLASSAVQRAASAPRTVGLSPCVSPGRVPPQEQLNGYPRGGFQPAVAVAPPNRYPSHASTQGPTFREPMVPRQRADSTPSVPDRGERRGSEPAPAAPSPAPAAPAPVALAQDPTIALIGKGSVFICEFAIAGVTLPKPLEPSKFFSQVEIDGQARRSPEVASKAPLRLIAGGEVPDDYIHILICEKESASSTPGSHAPVTFETAVSLKDIFAGLQAGQHGQVDLGMVPAGSQAGLPAIYRYCSSTHSGCRQRIQLQCAVHFRTEKREELPEGDGR